MSSCDLLEKSYFCSIANNAPRRSASSNRVVICLKNRTFAVSQTTGRRRCSKRRVLWFAWKIVLLQYRKQPRRIKMCEYAGCDLLEKSYFCSIANNAALVLMWKSYVVICLKNRTFAVSQTTHSHLGITPSELWFAWKIVLLQYRKQLLSYIFSHRGSCDLLEKSYFCSIANNLVTYASSTRPLWFAWKIVLLQYRKQPIIAEVILPFVVICLKNRTFAVSQTTSFLEPIQTFSCDLLEKSYFCSIANNRTSASIKTALCCDLLEKSYFCSIANNESRVYIADYMLWFAWKIVLLQYRKQRDLFKPICVPVVICLKNRTFAVSQTTYIERI